MSSQTKTLVVANSKLLAYNTATCLYIAGYRVDVICPQGWSPFRLSRFWHRYTPVEKSWFDTESTSTALVDYISTYCQHHQIAVVIPGDVTANLMILKHPNRIQSFTLFPVPTYQQFMELHNKWLFAQIAKACGANHPETFLLENPEQVQCIPLDYPVIVKPLAETSGRGVYEVKSALQLKEYAQECSIHKTLPILVQQRLEGYDLDLTILADHGEIVAWTIQKRRFEESAMEFLVDEAMLDLGRRIISHVGYHGVVDFDLRYDTNNNVPAIIEANPRFPGSLRYKLWSGVNLPAIGVAIALNQPRPVFKPTVGLCINYGISPKRLVSSLLQGRVIPPEFTGHTRTAWKVTVSDPIPHLLNWVSDQFSSQPDHVWYEASRLPDT